MYYPPMLPRPPFPPIDPIDPCRGYSLQFAYVNAGMLEISALLNSRSGSAFVANRASLMNEVVVEILKSFASDWSGIIPPFVPLLCRHLYSNLRTRQREAFRMLAMEEGRVDDFIGGKFVVDGFHINRPHNRKLRMQQWLQDLGY